MPLSTSSSGAEEGLLKHFALSLLVFTVVLLSAPGAAEAAARAAAEPPPAAPAAWTVALYVDADNNLGPAWSAYDLPELERLATTSDVNIVALVDMPGRRSGVKLLRFGSGHRKTLASYPEMDFGSAASLTWFLRRTHYLFPSEHLLVDIWDHGSAWEGFCWDDTSHSHITMAGLRAALVDAGVDIDILAFDTCLTGDVDVAYDVALAHRVRYMVASEESVPWDGLAYDAMLAPLAGEPSHSPEAVLADLLVGYQRYYRSLRCFTATHLAAVDVPRVLAMRADLQRWAALLRADLPVLRAAYEVDLEHSIYPWYSWQVDLRSIAARLAADPTVGAADPLLQQASQAVADDTGAAVLGGVAGSYVREFTGLTVWWGSGWDWSDLRRAYFNQSAFGQQVGWYDFLAAFNAHRSGDMDPPQPQLDRSRFGLTDVLFTDAQHGCAVGYDNRDESAILFVTKDGGAQWSRRRHDTSDGMYSALASPGGKRLVTFGDSGAYAADVLGSADAGRTWRTLASGPRQYVLDSDFTSVRVGWLAGTGGALWRTADGGAHWVRRAGPPAPQLTAVDFVDGQQGWVLGTRLGPLSGTVYHTTDGGKTFMAQHTVDGAALNGLAVAGTQDVWVVGGDPAGGGGLVLHSPDGGGTWETQLAGPATPWLTGVCMLDATHGWAVGDGGALYRTTDGISWSPVDSGTTEDLKAVTFVGDENGWVVGDGETVRATSDGGLTWHTQTPPAGADPMDRMPAPAKTH